MLFLDKVKIKHIIGIYKEMPDYPTAEDVIYEMSNHAVNKNKDLRDFTFTDNTAYRKISAESDLIASRLDQMVAENILEIIKETSSRKTYRIIKNPYI